ncbi:hypothetical protein GWK47_037352 [Chionoecetes opilio]|uniref:Uncharacterized protein n=1 Tax=Chionoecetes opilio TaxID=41210 RepID=A0A8J5D2B1_CHIOP|nr:hypothetical protein GWK47_037352 [Chionoecetes opilio]
MSDLQQFSSFAIEIYVCDGANRRFHPTLPPNDLGFAKEHPSVTTDENIQKACFTHSEPPFLALDIKTDFLIRKPRSGREEESYVEACRRNRGDFASSTDTAERGVALIHVLQPPATKGRGTAPVPPPVVEAHRHNSPGPQRLPFPGQAATMSKLVLLLPATHAACCPAPQPPPQQYSRQHMRRPVLWEPSGMLERAGSVPGGAAGLDCDLSTCNNGDSQNTENHALP